MKRCLAFLKGKLVNFVCFDCSLNLNSMIYCIQQYISKYLNQSLINLQISYHHQFLLFPTYLRSYYFLWYNSKPISFYYISIQPKKVTNLCTNLDLFRILSLWGSTPSTLYPALGEARSFVDSLSNYINQI